MTAAHDIKTHAEINLKIINNTLKLMQILTFNTINYTAMLYILSLYV